MLDKKEDIFITFCNECNWEKETRGLPYEFCPNCGHVNIGFSKKYETKIHNIALVDKNGNILMEIDLDKIINMNELNYNSQEYNKNICDYLGERRRVLDYVR